MQQLIHKDSVRKENERLFVEGVKEFGKNSPNFNPLKGAVIGKSASVRTETFRGFIIEKQRLKEAREKIGSSNLTEVEKKDRLASIQNGERALQKFEEKIKENPSILEKVVEESQGKVTKSFAQRVSKIIGSKKGGGNHNPNETENIDDKLHSPSFDTTSPNRSPKPKAEDRGAAYDRMITPSGKNGRGLADVGDGETKSKNGLTDIQNIHVDHGARKADQVAEKIIGAGRKAAQQSGNIKAFEMHKTQIQQLSRRVMADVELGDNPAVHRSVIGHRPDLFKERNLQPNAHTNNEVHIKGIVERVKSERSKIGESADMVEMVKRAIEPVLPQIKFDDEPTQNEVFVEDTSGQQEQNRKLAQQVEEKMGSNPFNQKIEPPTTVATDDNDPIQQKLAGIFGKRWF